MTATRPGKGGAIQVCFARELSHCGRVRWLRETTFEISPARDDRGVRVAAIHESGAHQPAGSAGRRHFRHQPATAVPAP